MYGYIIVLLVVVVSVIAKDPVEPVDDISLKDGDSVRLTCTLAVSMVTWRRDDTDLEKDLLIENTDIPKYVIDGNNLTVTVNRVKKEDVGNYTCTDGDLTEEVQLQAKPRIKDQYVKSLSIQEGSDLDHTCVVTWAWPAEVTVTWYKGDVELQTEDRVEISDLEGPEDGVTIPGGRLKIYNIRMEDRDDYICRVSNGVSENEHRVLVRVKSKLAPLWPFLGILVEVVILIVIIVLWEKNQKKKQQEESKED